MPGLRLARPSLARRTSPLCPGLFQEAAGGAGKREHVVPEVNRGQPRSSQVNTDRQVCVCCRSQFHGSDERLVAEFTTRGSELMAGALHPLPRCVIRSTRKAWLPECVCSPKCGSVGLQDISTRDSHEGESSEAFSVPGAGPVA